MLQKLLLQKNKLIIAGIVILLLGGGYYWYSSSLGSLSTGTAQFQAGLLKDKTKEFYAIKDRLNFNDSFMKGKNKDFFDQLVDYSVDIPTKDPIGRANPFVPYVTP